MAKEEGIKPRRGHKRTGHHGPLLDGMTRLEDTRAFVRLLSVLMQETHAYDKSWPKQLLWFNFLSR